MNMDRRGFLIAAGFAAFAPIALSAAKWRKAAGATSASANLFRPDATGVSAGVCAYCGTADHGTLDAQCPATLGPNSALQADARAHSARGAGPDASAIDVGSAAAAAATPSGAAGGATA